MTQSQAYGTTVVVKFTGSSTTAIDQTHESRHAADIMVDKDRRVAENMVGRPSSQRGAVSCGTARSVVWNGTK